MHSKLFDNPQLVLASGSRYRQILLAKLDMAFVAASPDIDESPRPGEKPEHLALRLAEEKAKSLAGKFASHIIIGSDQVAILEGVQLAKPSTHDKAAEQLRASAGKAVEFFTSVCALDSASGQMVSDLDRTVVHFRQLTDRQIEHYLSKDLPYDCAGSFKSEGLGIALLEKIDCEDANALVGLPLIKLVKLLAKLGVEVL